jgi:8-oxo-dGTP pyrophosphatase MutT (NUDIX family)
MDICEAAEIFMKTARTWGREGAGIMIICTEDQTVFLLRRSEDVEEGGTWGIAGGALQEGYYDETKKSKEDPSSEEEFIDTATTEVKEEMGSLPKGGEFVTKTKSRKGNFVYKTFVYNIPAVAKKGWSPSLNWESDEARWFSIDELPSNLHPGVSFTLKKIRRLFS